MDRPEQSAWKMGPVRGEDAVGCGAEAHPPLSLSPVRQTGRRDGTLGHRTWGLSALFHTATWVWAPHEKPGGGDPQRASARPENLIFPTLESIHAFLWAPQPGPSFLHSRSPPCTQSGLRNTLSARGHPTASPGRGKNPNSWPWLEPMRPSSLRTRQPQDLSMSLPCSVSAQMPPPEWEAPQPASPQPDFLAVLNEVKWLMSHPPCTGNGGISSAVTPDPVCSGHVGGKGWRVLAVPPPPPDSASVSLTSV